LPTISLEGAETTSSGLQYLEEVAGSGAVPKAGDLITMNFIASLADGTELVNTYTDGQPATVVWGKGNLLPGWEEGMGLMKAGGKAKLLLPPDLAFGVEGTGSIPANSQIVLEVELLKVEAPPVPTTVSADKLTTSSTGLQYYDIKVGDGKEATDKTTVFTDYTIWVKSETGYDFISTSKGDSPISFVVGRGDTVFPGWEEGVTRMKVGGKRLLVVPPELALGEQGGGSIPANATLVLEITLTDVKSFVQLPKG
jgi:peptidylprolyl isomerase